ncbi:MAG: hypothetical protein PWP52_1205 [Bacteroidales bacterium]|nr:hypothetical protein [Bacteroidales bacterium]MDN5291355.1 hypothetical protein [Anaerophaga sp.]
MRHKLIVISLDSLQTTDLRYLKTKPNFSKILEKGAVVQNVREIYPTLTYPIHTSIITGVHPNKHGITHNQMPSIEPENPNWSIMGSDWYWYSDYIKVPTLMDVANEASLVTASVMWPVMAGKKPTHNLAEIWPNRHEPMKTTFERACTEEVMALYYDKYFGTFNWTEKIDADSYAIPIAVDMIQRFNPDLMLIHSVCLDHERHVSGVEGPKIDACLNRIDDIVGEIIEASQMAGSFDQTNFVLLGDHGQLTIQKVFLLNVLLKEKGLIQTGADGKVTRYDAYSFSAGFSTHIILNNPEDEVMKEKVYSVLLEIQRDYEPYIGRIFNECEVDVEEGLSGDFSFVIESGDGVIFDNELGDCAILEVKIANNEVYKGMHGHHPSKGHKPPFIAFGPDVKSDVVINSGDLLDICPTLVKLLDVQMDNLEGNPFLIFK